MSKHKLQLSNILTQSWHINCPTIFLNMCKISYAYFFFKEKNIYAILVPSSYGLRNMSLCT